MELIKIHLPCFSWDKSRIEEDGDENMVPETFVPTGKFTPYNLYLI